MNLRQLLRTCWACLPSLTPLAICALLNVAPLPAQTVSTVADRTGITDALTLGADGQTLYGSAYGTTRVHALELPDGQSSVFGNVTTSANGNVLGADGALYVADDRGNRIYRYPLDSSGTAEVFAQLPSPNGLFRLPGTDTLLVASYPNNTVSTVAPNGSITLLTSGGELNGPAGMAQGSDGQLYVANYNDGKVIRVLPDGTQELLGTFGGGQTTGFIAAVGDFLYGTLITAHRIERMRLSTGEVEHVAGLGRGSADGSANEARFNGPNGIVATPGGDSLYVSEINTGNIRLLTDLGGTSNLSTALADAYGLQLHVGPNPSVDAVNVFVTLQQSTGVSLVLREADGRETITRTPLGHIGVGTTVHTIDVMALATGMYMMEVLIEGRVALTKIVQVLR